MSFVLFSYFKGRSKIFGCFWSDALFWFIALLGILSAGR
jgi:hypothetical protein